MVPASARVITIATLALACCVPLASQDGQRQTRGWETVRLDAAFRSEGVAVADVDRDGHPDVLAGEVWYEAPGWKRHELAPPGVYDPATGYSDCFVAAAADVDGDGWPDLLSVGFPGAEARWCENPKGAAGPWPRHVIATNVCNESPQFVDVNGDGKLDLLMGHEANQTVSWLEAGPDPRQPWVEHKISVPGQPGCGRFYHGLGLADVDGDGRRDVLTPEGWYAAPANLTAATWTLHAANLMGNGPTGPQMAAQMCAFDFDGDGDLDVATSSPHAYGLWWWEQSNTAPGTFTPHLIADSFSQSHSLVLADLDGDGLPDLVTGKRWYAHGPLGDPGVKDPAVLVWFRLRRSAAGVAFEQRVIDDDSGVGTQFVVADVDGDGRPDVVTSNKKGVYVHLRRGR
jgi:hypothetical protein